MPTAPVRSRAPPGTFARVGRNALDPAARGPTAVSAGPPAAAPRPGYGPPATRTATGRAPVVWVVRPAAQVDRPRRSQGKPRLLRVLVVAHLRRADAAGPGRLRDGRGRRHPVQRRAAASRRSSRRSSSARNPSSTTATASCWRASTSGGERRRVIDWEDVPPILADSVTAVEDRTFWTNTGFDPLGIASAAIDSLTGAPAARSTITQQLVRQRLLPRGGHAGVDTPRRTQDQGAHPVGARHRGVPRPRRQAGHHHRVPQPELLRQQQLRRDGRGARLLRRH